MFKFLGVYSFAVFCLLLSQNAYAAPSSLDSLFGNKAELLSDDTAKTFNVWVKWQNVLDRMQNDTLTDPFEKMPAHELHPWKQVLKLYPTLKPLAQARLVSAFFNMWPSKTDEELYGEVDYWATPDEFIKNYGGDCEDYVIVKYKALELLGWPADKMWIVLVQDNELKRGHAILALNVDDKVYILDNLSTPSDLALEQSKYTGYYTPYYALNANGIWRFYDPTKQRTSPEGSAPLETPLVPSKVVSLGYTFDLVKT